MSYAKLLTNYIEKSTLSFNGIAELCNKKGFSIDHSYISKLKNGKMPPPSEELSRVLAEVLGGDSEVLIIEGYKEKEPKEIKKTAGEKPPVKKQRLNLLNADKHVSIKHTIPLLGTIRAGIPLISEQNIIGCIDIPEDLVGRANFALNVNGDSMIGAGINDGDVALCKEGNDAVPGQIVVALVNNDETTLKYYIRENGRAILKAANPEYKDIELKPGDRIQGHLVKILKDPPPVNLYREYIFYKEGHLQEWNDVIEKATAAGIKPMVIREMISAQLEIAKRLTGK